MFASIIEFIKEKKFLFFILVVVLLLLFTLKIVLPFTSEIQANRSPIISIEAKNDNEYKQDQKIAARDFTVIAIHENGKRTNLNAKEFDINRTYPNKTGSITKVKVTLLENDSISCVCKVKNRRRALLKFKCGTPNLDDVKAVLYDNGELCFEGEGDVLQFNDFPWKEYEESDTEIKTVTFEDGVQPTVIDGWFSDIDSLISVKMLPESVESAVGTFEDCVNLTEAPDLKNNNKILNLSSCFKGCASLTNVADLPSSVISTSEMFNDCILLEKAPDITGCSKLEDASEMFAGCTNLIAASMAPKVKYIDAMYKDCINLVEMPEIPDSVLTMSECFSGDIKLQSLTNIPKNVMDVSNCFSSCTRIEGKIIVSGEPEEYRGCFTDAAAVTKVTLTGTSSILNLLKEDNENIIISGTDKTQTTEE